MKFINKRQNPIDNRPPEDIENTLEAICDYFSESWLCKKDGSHILQKLWNRKDALSTVELFTFGRAILLLQKIDQPWIDNQLKLVKAKDVNNQRGAIFEILAISYLCTKQLATPAPMNQKGYDVDVDISGSEIYRISLKSYSQSSHERIFQQRMDIARKKYLSQSRAGAKFSFQLYISAKKWPTENDWQLLYAELINLSSIFHGNPIVKQIENSWIITIMPLSPEPNENIDDRKTSYTFIGIAPYHQNEQQNFISKLDSAVYNLEKHVKSELTIYPFVIIRLPPNASATTMNAWVVDYFSNNPNTILSGVIFFQPYTATTPNGASSFVTHYFSPSVSIKFLSSKKRMLQFEVPVGTVTDKPPTWQLNHNGGATAINDQYVYQYGEHYIRPKNNSNGCEGNITRKAPGIKTFLVVDHPNGGAFVIAGLWGEELCLIGG